MAHATRLLSLHSHTNREHFAAARTPRLRRRRTSPFHLPALVTTVPTLPSPQFQHDFAHLQRVPDSDLLR